MQWNKLAKIGARNLDQISTNKVMGGHTHDIGSSFSSKEKKRSREIVKNHKLSCDSSLLQKGTGVSRFNSSPSAKNPRRIQPSLANQNHKYNENEALKEYLNSKRQNSSPLKKQVDRLNTYFNSLEFPYDEMKLYLENNESIPQMTHMNTKESNISTSNREFANTENDTSHDIINLKASKERHLPQSERHPGQEDSCRQ